MSDDSNYLTVLSDSVELQFNVLGVFSYFLLVLGEGLLLTVHPILIESSQGIFG